MTVETYKILVKIMRQFSVFATFSLARSTLGCAREKREFSRKKELWQGTNVITRSGRDDRSALKTPESARKYFNPRSGDFYLSTYYRAGINIASDAIRLLIEPANDADKG